MDFPHWPFAFAGCFLMLILAVAHLGVEDQEAAKPYLFSLLLVIAVLLIVYGFGAPR
jgi:hypothetical protein